MDGPADDEAPDAAYLVVEADDQSLPDLTSMRLAWAREKGLGEDEDFGAVFGDWWERQAGHRRAWLVRDGHHAVAMANVAVFERMPWPGREPGRWGYVGNVWVDPRHRRRGVGRLLMDHVLDWAREERLERIVLNPSEISRPLYTDLGFRAADDLLRLDL